MKKRILSILLTLCMMLCLTPISVFAEEVGTEGSAAIQLGADALSVLSKNVNTATAPTVYFGQNHENNPAAWRVIGYDGSGVTSSKGDITLLAAGAMGVIPFVDTILNNEYAPSNLKTAIDALAEKLTTEENAAVKKRTLTSGSYDGENTDCVAGGQVDNAVFWPLSAKEAIAVNNDLRALNPAHPNWVDSGWWLRSPGSDKYRLAVVRSEGSVQYSGFSVLIFNNHRTVRPAFNLNLNSVLFASAAVGGKPDGGLTPIPEYSGNEWKLTLLDSRRNFAVTEKTVSAVPDDTVTLNYKGATRGKNEYISVILADNNGAQYYGRVAQPTTESGTVEIKIPSDIAPGDYTMKVFSEQYNGDCKTDLASAFADVTLTVESQPDEQFTLAPGGRYYFDLSAMDIPGTVNSNLPDSTLHYVPFTYAGTVDAYVLKPASNHVEDSSEQASVTKDKNAQYGYAYEHSLFIADYRVTTNISWIDLNNAGFIFGKTNTAGGINYTLRAPTMGSIYKSPMRGAPANNEWDQILTKNSDFIKELDNNRNISLFWGQDTSRSYDFNIRKTTRNSVNNFMGTTESSNYGICFRPVLEVLNSDTLGSDGLKVVTLDLGGGTLGNSSEDIQIIVKNGESFTAPATEGLSRPNSISEDAQLYWSDENGNCYKPGDTVPADVSRLSITGDYEVIYLPGTYGTGSAVTDMKPHNNILTLRGALFTRTGYTQVGWATVDGGEKVYDLKDIYTKNEALTLYPVWNANQYTITFDTAGGSEVITKTIEVTYGEQFGDMPVPKREGYVFLGWYDALVGGKCYGDSDGKSTSPYDKDVSITLYAQWAEAPSRMVYFNTCGGTMTGPVKVLHKLNTPIAKPDNPTKPGHTFNGWYTDSALTQAWNFDDWVTGELRLYAGWTVNQYTITFDTNGGSEIAPITQDYGTEITAPDNPTRKGYTFKGWDKEIPETMPAENITVKAQWEINQYTITFDTNGGSEIAPITQDYGTEITAPDNPTRKGYTFKGWDKEIPETMPAENITVKAQWEINQYTITFDTNGGSEIAPITQDYGTEITAPDNPTRKGYTFKGWDKEIPETMPAENITVKAQWEINQYTITFDTNGGSEIAPITQDYGTEITAPDNPTRKGYTFKGWDKEIPETMPAENITVKAQWEINQYTITFDTNGGSEIAPITQDYGTEITAPDNPTRKGYTFKGWDKEIPKTMPAENITITARWRDTEKPTGEIIIGTNKWNEFLNELTFGIFFKDTQEVTINAVDNSGVVFVSYLVTDKELSEAELNSLVFRAYEEPFCIDPNGEYIVYVMLVDENINITYLRSDRLTLDNIQPVISGIENGKIYCEAQTVTVDEKYVDTVTVNGTVVTLDADGGFVLPPTNGEQKIVVTDKAGNNAEMTVTVNNGHTFGEWVSDNDGKHTRKCTVDGCDAFETENCSGGNATCTEKAVCDVCGKAYGEFDGTNHEGGVQEWTTRTAFNHEQKWNCCDAVIVASEAHEWKDGVCRECGYVCLHNDADKDHICDYCKKTISEHVDKDKNHICDYCEKTISAHEDAPTKEIKKADTVTAKLPDNSKSPQTGDNSNLILWIALLIISGGVMKGVTAFGKSKKHSAKIKDK